MNEQLKSLFEQDQADHSAGFVYGTSEYFAMRSRDADRRTYVRSIVGQSASLSPDDLYQAAWILNHGDSPADAELAHQLAARSAELGFEAAKWLYAASYDRWCMYRGKLQKFGTQIVPDGVGYRVWETDPNTTDEDRKRYNVPPISEMRKRALADSKRLEQPPMNQAPKWLADAVLRWKTQSET